MCNLDNILIGALILVVVGDILLLWIELARRKERNKCAE
jgi:hypothetical protein